MSENVSLPRAEKLTKWMKEPSVMDLKEDLTAAKPAHDAHSANIRRWLRLRDARGPAKSKNAKKNRSNIQPKLIRRQNEWRYSALSEPFLSAEKLYNIQPVTFEDRAAANQNEIVLNWQFRTKIDVVNFIDEYVRTAVDEGSVIVRLGWKRITRKVMKSVPVFQYTEIQTEEELQPLVQAMELKQQNPRGFDDLPEELKAAVEYLIEVEIPTVAHIVGMEEVEEEEIVENTPTVDIVDPDNVFIDPSCNGDIKKAGFVISSFESSKAELLKDGRYKNLDVVNWSGNSILAQPDHKTETPNDFNFNDDLRKRVVVYEYWGYYDVDGTEELKPIVATWIGDTMIRMEDNPFPDEKPPFVLVPYLPVRRQLMGEPDAEILEDNQEILGAVTRGAIDLMGRSANAQQGMAKGFLDVTNKRRFEQGEDYEFNPGTGGPDGSIYHHRYPEIPNSVMTMMSLQNQEAEALSGVKSFSGGLSGEGYGDVASGIRGMIDAAAKREMNILRRLIQGVKQIGIKIMAMNGVFLSEVETVRVTNEEFIKVKREDLKGNFDTIVDIATAEIDEIRAQDLGFMLQTIGPNMDHGIRSKILSKIAKLKRMPDLAREIRDYRPEPDPLEVERAQLENEKLKLENEKIKSEIEKNLALAGRYKSEHDLNDLDFVEEETGTKHARNIQAQSQQAAANQNLEVTKALLRQNKPEEQAPDVAAAVGYNHLTDPVERVRNI